MSTINNVTKAIADAAARRRQVEDAARAASEQAARDREQDKANK